MAEKLKTFTFSRTSGGKNGRDWSQWTDGSPWKLTQGEDFTCKTNTMATQARKFAKENGFTVRISVLDDQTLVLQFLKEDGESPQPPSKPAKGSTRARSPKA